MQQAREHYPKTVEQIRGKIRCKQQPRVKSREKQCSWRMEECFCTLGFGPRVVLDNNRQRKWTWTRGSRGYDQGRSYVMWSGSTDPDDSAIASRTLRILASTDLSKKKCLHMQLPKGTPAINFTHEVLEVKKNPRLPRITQSIGL
jgi:hypothetical protein